MPHCVGALCVKLHACIEVHKNAGLRRFTIQICLALTSGCWGCASQQHSIECSFYYRQSPTESNLEEVVLQVAANETDTATLGQLRLDLRYSDDKFEGPSAGVSVLAGDEQTFGSLYQLKKSKLPNNQFQGDHGFTGLIYLTHPTQGGDYQLICRSVE